MITFLHKVENGPADKSYGIHVAKLAQMPEELLIRAKEILDGYENGEKAKVKPTTTQLSMDLEEEKTDLLREKLKSVDPLHLTPMDALNLIFELKEIE